MKSLLFALSASVALGSVEPALEPLPPGQIEPSGWLRDWCITAKDGYTGNMDSVDDEFKRAWTESYAADHKDVYQWYKGAWSLEGGGYWFDGLVRLAYCLHDESLIAQARARLAPAITNASPNACMFLWWMNRDAATLANIKNNDGWVIWASGLLSRAVAGEYDATRDPTILNALKTAYGSDTNSLRQRTWSLSSVTAAYQTWRWSKDPAVAKALDNLADDAHSDLNPEIERYRNAPDLTPGVPLPNMHGVEAVEGCTPWALMYLYTGRKQYLDAALGWHERIYRISMQPNGAPAMYEYYQYSGGAAATETCDTANYLWSQLLLLAATGDGKFADRAERCFFNAGPGMVTRDFKKHVYLQPVNRLANGGGQWTYQQKHGPLCCTAALNRVIPYYVTSMWMATPDGGYKAVCYGPAALKTDKIEVACTTDYPFGETLTFAVTAKSTAAVPLHFHVPAWCKGATLTLNGDAAAFDLNRAWKTGDTLILRLPMAPVFQKVYDRGSSLTAAHWNGVEPRAIPVKGDDIGAPCATVSCGPLLFTLGIPEKDGDPNAMADGAKWQYALDIDNPGLTLTRTAMPQTWAWPLDAPVKIEVNAVAIPEWTPEMTRPQCPAITLLKPATVARERISLVPYGCAKLRLAMFPTATAVAVPIEVEKPADGLYDAGKAMKAKVNGGTWSYGTASTPGGALTLLPNGLNVADFAVQGFGTSEPPFIGVNISKASANVPVAMDTDRMLAPGEIILHPANSDPMYVVVRFTVKRAGAYSAHATFRDLKANPGAQALGAGLGAETMVAVNGKVLMKGVVSVDAGTDSVDGVSASCTFTLSPTTLNEGATIDFIVGPDGNYGYDATGLKASVTCEE